VHKLAVFVDAFHAQVVVFAGEIAVHVGAFVALGTALHQPELAEFHLLGLADFVDAIAVLLEGGEKLGRMLWKIQGIKQKIKGKLEG
jgi:hypothetical protein